MRWTSRGSWPSPLSATGRDHLLRLLGLCGHRRRVSLGAASYRAHRPGDGRVAHRRRRAAALRAVWRRCPHRSPGRARCLCGGPGLSDRRARPKSSIRRAVSRPPWRACWPRSAWPAACGPACGRCWPNWPSAFGATRAALAVKEVTSGRVYLWDLPSRDGRGAPVRARRGPPRHLVGAAAGHRSGPAGRAPWRGVRDLLRGPAVPRRRRGSRRAPRAACQRTARPDRRMADLPRVGWPALPL